MNAEPMIEVRGLKKSFGDIEVLRNISLTVERGQVVALIGPSGSGKSTLLRSLNLLSLPDAGYIAIGEQKIDFVREPVAQRQISRGIPRQYRDGVPELQPVSAYECPRQCHDRAGYSFEAGQKGSASTGYGTAGEGWACSSCRCQT